MFPSAYRAFFMLRVAREVFCFCVFLFVSGMLGRCYSFLVASATFLEVYAGNAHARTSAIEGNDISLVGKLVPSGSATSCDVFWRPLLERVTDCSQSC